MKRKSGRSSSGNAASNAPGGNASPEKGTANAPAMPSTKSLCRSALAALALTAGYCAIWLLATFGLSMLFAELVSVWGVTASNAAYAPRWLQLLYPNLNAAIGIGVSFFLIALTELAGRLLGQKRKQPTARRLFHRVLFVVCGFAAGALAAALLIGFLRLTDSIRFAARAVHFTPDAQALIAALNALFAIIAWELFFRGLLLPFSVSRLEPKDLTPMTTRNPSRTALWIYLPIIFVLLLETASALLFSGASYIPVNMALMGLGLCLLNRRSDTIAAGVAFRFAFVLGDLFAFGASSGRFSARAALGVYGVSENWLSGGAAGLMSGALTSMLFAALIALLLLWARKRPAA